jgi:hypothetical protein
MSEPGLLSVSLASDPIVGSNRKGALAGGGWLYALPTLDHPRIVCVGAPSMGTLAGLVRAGTVLVVEPHERRRRALADRVTAAGWPHVTVAADVDEGAIDLLLVLGDDAIAFADRLDLDARLSMSGVRYAEPAKPAGTAGEGPGRPGHEVRLHLTPLRGEPRSVVPAGDAAMEAAIRRMGLEGSVLPRRWSGLERRALRSPAMRSRARREALISGPGIQPGGGVPRYIGDVAAADGHDLTAWRWAIAARGDYDSQKVLVLLAPPDGTAPTGLAKVTRSAAHTARLSNEASALAALGDLPVAEGRAPRRWFWGEHAGRGVLGASIVDGPSFTARASFKPDDPWLRDALGWLTDLAVASARPTAAEDVATALRVLLTRYVRIYGPTTDEADRLEAMIGSLHRIDGPIPSVFQHGDPGIWNLVAQPDGRTGFLDWEAAELTGLPLFDLFYCFRSYAIATSRRAGTRDRLDAASRHLLDGSPLGDRLVETVDDYRRRVELPAAAIEPLLYGCWIHRSLKEATRLAPEGLQRGQFVRLIRRMLEQPDAPVMRRLRDLDDAPTQPERAAR